MSSQTKAERRYKLRGAPIIHDTIDNETIAINQLTGAYYSLEGAAALLWQGLTESATATEAARHLAAAHGVAPDDLLGQVGDFLEELLAEELVVATEEGRPVGPRAGTNQRAAAQPAATQAGDGLITLRLQRYTDLEVMLLADPIHEVDDTGWPMPLTDRRE